MRLGWQPSLDVAKRDRGKSQRLAACLATFDSSGLWHRSDFILAHLGIDNMTDLLITLPLS